MNTSAPRNPGSGGWTGGGVADDRPEVGRVWFVADHPRSVAMILRSPVVLPKGVP
jgi:hypothetical protein